MENEKRNYGFIIASAFILLSALLFSYEWGIVAAIVHLGAAIVGMYNN